ncbi:phospholipase A1-IIdelta-like isoform X1 [Primulina eburnea]|uniref:phospholipase A1-IIdelta-like isoform X1 n=1 Tax=Primulina eburnea TaxID=1245227 RepID=UPI003C6C4BB8
MAVEPAWEELLGSKDWEGLVDPLNLSLRKLILRCGNFCQGTYDAFDNDEFSKYAGSSRYGKKSFFQKVKLESASDYQVQSFLYATTEVGFAQAIFLHSLSHDSWDRESNWIGYIAVTTDEVSQALGRREIYIAWRGTITGYEWVNDLVDGLEPIDELLHKETSEEADEKVPKVMGGWLKLYVSSNPDSSFTKFSARTQLRSKIQELRNQYKDEKLSIIVTGHSLGGSLATLSAFDLVENGITDIPVAAIVFCCPHVGEQNFVDRVKKYPNLKVLHIKNEQDLFPKYPLAILGYRSLGTKLELDNNKSPNLKASTNPLDWHNLEALLHTVAGWNGATQAFELKVQRSLALVNKSSGILKDENLIPSSWWVVENKGMILDEKGEWILAPADAEDVPKPEAISSDKLP